MSDSPATSTELELLARDAAATTYPATPSLAAGVLARLETPARPLPVRSRRTVRLVAAGIATVGAFGAAAVIVSNDAREAVAELFGFAVPSEQITILPTPLPGVTPTAFPPAAPFASYAMPVTAAEMHARLPYALGSTEVLGEPVQRYLAVFDGQPVAILDYGRFVVWETESASMAKGLVFTKGTVTLEELRVNDVPGYWMDGSHLLAVLDGTGAPIAASQRTVEGRTLAWFLDGRNYRIESTSLTRDEVLAIAESLP